MEVGPVDVYIIGFPGNKFSGKIAPAIIDLVEAGTIRVLDLLFVMKDDDGAITTIAAEDLDAEGAGFLEIDITEPGSLNEEDAEEVGDDLPANSSALLIAFENTWAAKVVSALRDADAVLIDSIRIPAEVVEQALDAASPPTRTKGNEMGLLRMAARTAVVAGTATAVSGRVAHRQNEKYAAQDQAAYDQQQAAYDAAQQAAAARRPRPRIRCRAPEAGDAPRAGCAHRRGVHGRQGQGARALSSRRAVEAYSRLAGVYDEIVVDPCHGRWASYLDELWAGERPRRPRRLLRHRPARRRARRARLPRHRRRRVGGDARPGPDAARAGRPARPGDAAGPGGRGHVRRRRLHVRRAELPRAGRAPCDLRRARRPAAPGWLARLRRPHRRDDGLHRRRSPVVAGETGRPAASRSRAPSTRPRERVRRRSSSTRPTGSLRGGAPPVVPRPDAELRAALAGAGFAVDRASTTSTPPAGRRVDAARDLDRPSFVAPVAYTFPSLQHTPINKHSSPLYAPRQIQHLLLSALVGGVFGLLGSVAGPVVHCRLPVRPCPRVPLPCWLLAPPRKRVCPLPSPTASSRPLSARSTRRRRQ